MRTRLLIFILLAFTFTFFASPILAVSSSSIPLTTSTPSAAPSATSAAVPAASGQTPFDYTQGKPGLPLPATVSPTSPLYTDLIVNNLFHSFSCIAIGQSLIGQPCLTYRLTQNAQRMVQGVPVLSQVNTSGGVLGATGNLIGLLYQNPPVRTADYLASVSGGFGVVKQANAQVFGSGAAVLNPILRLWQVSRNISYVIMIVVFVVIGLMIMFRNKINPQTVITAQAALPGLVIGLILITFSYFFAGLISDMAFVGTNIVGYYFQAAQGNGPQDLVTDMNQRNALSIISPFTGLLDKDTAADILSGIWGSLSESARQLLTILGVFITIQTTGQATEALKAIPLIGAPAQAIISIGAATAALVNPTAIIGIALAFVATAILMYSMLKLLFRLINAYLTIILLTFAAPFQLLAAALPGRQSIATSWILNMLANILAFPAVLAVLYFVAFLLGPTFVNQHCVQPCVFKLSQQDRTQDGTFPSTAYAAGLPDETIVGNRTFPLFGGLDLNFLNIILAFGALVALPSIPDIIGRTIGRLGVAGQLIGQEISGGVGQGRQYAGRFQQGVGSVGGQAAQARGLFPTSSYEAVVEKGKIVGYKPSFWNYQPGGFGKLSSWIGGRRGTAGGGGGGVPTKPPGAP